MRDSAFVRIVIQTVEANGLPLVGQTIEMGFFAAKVS